eukprot:TRINITY_DN6490_c0_g1_i2.p1 TRINITY_DN6490_c0_g1~~TRINITY_DN6490_c0_g1_i2.p1  ORF type:complete len:193 (+),score=29.50 TRINITY_DN6490_c0_g1_i2:134-712(+)
MQRGLVGSEMCIRDRYQRRVHGKLCTRKNCPYGKLCPDIHSSTKQQEIVLPSPHTSFSLRHQAPPIFQTEDNTALVSECQILESKIKAAKETLKQYTKMYKNCSYLKYWKCQQCEEFISDWFYYYPCCEIKLCKNCHTSALKVEKCPICQSKPKKEIVMVELQTAEASDLSGSSESSDESNESDQYLSLIHI